jgi:hypothetical protein
MRCPEADVRRMVSGSLSDRGVHRGRRTRPRGHQTGQGSGRSGIRAWVQVVMPRGPAAQATAGLPKGAHGHCLHVRSWPGEEGGEVIGLARCIVQRSALEVSASGPSPAGRVRAHRPGGHIELGCPAGRTVGRFRHVGRPASHCPVSVRGTDRRRRCPGGCPAAAPWRKPAARLTAGMSVRHGEVLEVPARAVQGWAHEPT